VVFPRTSFGVTLARVIRGCVTVGIQKLSLSTKLSSPGANVAEHAARHLWQNNIGLESLRLQGYAGMDLKPI